MIASPPFLVFAGLLLATGALRLVELAVSVRRVRARPDALVAEPGLFPAMALLHVGLVVAPIAEVLALDRPFLPLVAGIAGTGLCLATGLRIWTLRTIGTSWNVRVVVPQAIAITGPYAWIRHPNYLCVIVEIACLPLLHTAWIAALGLSAVNAVVLWRRIRTEEAALSQIPAWRDAMADRWRLVPWVL
jgi:methyltransferase